MQKSITLLSNLCAVALVSAALLSCKDDDEPVVPKVSFSATTREVKESGDTIHVTIKLDKPAPKDIVVEYTIGEDDTALEFTVAGQDGGADYLIIEDNNDYGEVKIAKGQTSGVIEIQLGSDYDYEPTEKMTFKISKVDAGVEITRDDETEVKLLQEDGLIVALYWDAAAGTSYADMDLILRIGAPNATSFGVNDIVGLSAAESNVGPEYVFIPKLQPNAAFGLSVTYYAGTYDPLKFELRYIDFVNGALEAATGYQVFKGQYTIANINKWTSATIPTLIVQTFVKSGADFTNISAITVPSPTSSRSVMAAGTPLVQHNKGTFYKRMLKF